LSVSDIVVQMAVVLVLIHTVSRQQSIEQIVAIAK
jgi:hypothetical protein